MKKRITNSIYIRKYKISLFILVILTFLIMLVLNFMNGYYADDYIFSNAKNQSILKGSIDYYMQWGGRFPITFMVRLVLELPKWIFNFMSAFMFTILTILIYLHSTNSKEIRPSIYIFVLSMCWIFIPHFNETVLWLNGTIAYLWPTVIMLFCLLPYKIYLEYEFEFTKNRNRIFIIFMALLGFFSGWGIENASGGCILFICIIIYIYHYKGRKIRTWHISTLISSLIGFIILIVAPGNYVRRTEITSHDSSLLSEVLYSFRYITEFMLDNYLILCIGFFLLLMWQYYESKMKEILLPIIWFVVGVATIYALSLSPYVPERSYFTGAIFIILSLTILLATIKPLTKSNKKLVFSIIIIAFAKYSAVLFNESINIARTYQIYDKREDYIKQEKSNGNYNLIFPSYPVSVYPVSSKYVPFEMLQYDHYQEAFCTYHQLNSIELIPYEEWTLWEQWIKLDTNVGYKIWKKSMDIDKEN